MTSKLKGNMCPKCEKTHEKCADGNRCPKSEISRYVCIVFGTRRAR